MADSKVDTGESGQYLALPPSDCCKKGTLHSGEPTGTFETLAGFNTYIAKPTQETANGNVLFYFADVWGFFNNAFLTMDRFADAGYLVLGIDYFHGDTYLNHMEEEGFDFMAWVFKYVAIADEGVPRWTKAVTEKYGAPNTKYACVGYCFGGPYVCKELAADGNCSVGAFAHPGLLTEAHFENLTKPLFMSSAVIDPLFLTEQRQRAVDILNEAGKPFHLQVFQGVNHGYGLRANLDNPYERWVREHCHKTMVDWFDYWLSQN